MILSCCAVDFASAERAFSCVHWLASGITRAMRTAHAMHRGSSAIASSAAGLRVCRRLMLSAQHIRRTQAELVGFSANAPSPRRAHRTRAVQSHSAPRPAPPLDHIESGARCGGLFCVRAARVPKGLGALERGGTRESGRATYLGYEKRYVLDAAASGRASRRESARLRGCDLGGGRRDGGVQPAVGRSGRLVADGLSAALLLSYSSQTWGEEREAVEEALRWVTTDRHDMTDRLTACREPPSPAVLLLA